MSRLTIVLLALAFLSVLVVGSVLLNAYGRAKSAEQPIAFSHKIHAEDFKIACEYCHAFARRSAVAGIPSVQRCMGCHKITAANKPEVKKLQQYWNQKEPIQWQKVTSMPDFVYFEHWPHVRSGIACQTCHGSIETMDQTRKVRDLTMSECLACHRERQASLDCYACHR